MTKQEILDRLAALELDAREYWVVAGAVMVLYGLRERTHDIDLGCTAALADALERRVPPERTPDGARMFRLDGDVEIFENYRIGPVTEVCGVPVVTLDGLCAMKRALGREKDLRDVERIERALPPLSLRPVGSGDPACEWTAFRDTPPENGWENAWYGCDYETYRSKALPQMQQAAAGEGLAPGRVADTKFLLWDRGEPVAIYNVRHYLTPALAASAGHIGYAVRPDRRGRGYASRGLALAVDALRALPDFDGGEVYLSCLKTNLPSLRAMLRCGGYLHHTDETGNYVRIPERKSAGTA